MTKLFNEAVEAVSRLPAERQDQLAELILDLAQSDPYRLSAAEQIAIAEGRTDIAAGRVVEEKDIQATLARLRSA